MDTKQAIVRDEKSAKHYDEVALKPSALENADYTGAEAKTDPVEIALVKKIDWRLMVCTSYKSCWNLGLTTSSQHYVSCIF
jgi:hypothetical protein